MRTIFTFVFAAVAAIFAAVPTPKDHFGFNMGDDKKMANYGEIIAYLQKLEASSDRLKMTRFGTTADNRPMWMGFISSPENLKKLDLYKDINRKLALAQVPRDEARRLAATGKAIVWIDAGIHSAETAPVQHVPELAYKMLSGDNEEIRRILNNVILILVPNINPDGTDWVVDWHRKNVGTPYEMAPLVKLYHKYAGHDNNRDWYMMNLPETRHISKQLFEEWFPQIVYNQHQMPPYPARIFIPPYAEPLNPNIPPAIMEGIHLIGAAMKERFAIENKPGALSYWGFDAWWNGGLRSAPAFHNMHGILTETAGWGYAASREVKLSDLPDRFGNGIPTKEPSVFYQMPWLGGKWTFRDPIEYNLTADFAILDLAATRSASFLLKAYEVAKQNIDMPATSGPYAYVVSAEQWDRSAANEMLQRLALGGISIKRASAPFEANGKKYPEGSSVMLAGQPFRGYLVDLMEAHKYPEIRTGTTGPTKRPYDIAGWTLHMLMGVSVDRIDKPFDAKLQETGGTFPVPPTSKDHREVSSFQYTADALAKGEAVRWDKEGKILSRGDSGFDTAAWELAKPRVAVYEPWVTNMDSGWSDWLLDYYRVPHSMLHNEDLQRNDLRSRFDTIILPSQSVNSILHGVRDGEKRESRFGGDSDDGLQRPEYTGGIELQGLANLQKFVREGGTVLAFDAATQLPAQMFPLPLRLLIRPDEGGRDSAASSGYYCPGSLIRIDVDNTNPIAFGMPPQAIAYSQGGQAFEIMLLKEFNKGDRATRSIASYAKKDLLASGWISGERAVLGRPIVVESRHGQGRVVLYGFRPQFRGQTFGTFKLVLNAIYLASAKTL